MKPLIIIVVIIAIIGVLNAYTGAFIDKSSSDLLSVLEKTKSAVQSGDAETAISKIKELRDEWEVVESRWEVLVDHREVERIDTLMTHLEAMSAAGTWDTIMPELDELAFYLTHINDKQKVRGENIL